MRHFLLALQFFTRMPVTGRLAAWVGYSPAMLRAAAGHFPGAGWVVGSIGAGVFLLASLAWPPLVAAVLAIAATAAVTGAFHEDGLADTFDGLGGSADAERAQDIMRDSRIGTYGALALLLVVAAKLAALAAIAERQGATQAAGALVVAHVLSRGLPLLLMARLPHVGGPKSKPLADAVSPATLWVAVLWCFPAAAGLGIARRAIDLVAILAALALMAWVLGRWFRRRLGGFTGDCLGCTQQLGEVAVYLVLAAAWR